MELAINGDPEFPPKLMGPQLTCTALYSVRGAETRPSDIGFPDSRSLRRKRDVHYWTPAGHDWRADRISVYCSAGFCRHCGTLELPAFLSLPPPLREFGQAPDS